MISFYTQIVFSLSHSSNAHFQVNWKSLFSLFEVFIKNYLFKTCWAILNSYEFSFFYRISCCSWFKMAASSSWVSTRSKNQELDSPHKRIKDFKSIRKNLEKLGQNLTVLNLAHNAIFEIPDYLTVLCPNLKRLNLANNKIKVVPSHLGSLKKLEHLNLAFNEIKILPVTFGNLICLTHLDLSRNLLTDDSLMNPPKIFDLRTIERLYLSDNFLEKIGPEFGTFGNLKILALRYLQIFQ